MPNESNPVWNVGKVQKFVVRTDFQAYAEQLEFFFVVNGVTDLNNNNNNNNNTLFNHATFRSKKALVKTCAC